MKLHVLRAGLRLRRERPRTFLEGGYAPIDAGDDLVAFSRNHAAGSVVCVVTRRPHRVTGGLAPFPIGDVWRDRALALPRGRWRDVLTNREHVIDGAPVALATLLEDLPVALLASV